MNACSASVTVIVCAAGKGERAGFSKNKLLVPVQGSTVLERTLSAFDLPAVSEILVTSSTEDFSEISSLCRNFPRTRAVPGGNTRFDSVYNALEQTQSEIVIVHDGARPFVKAETIFGCIESVRLFGSGVCAVPAVDTVALIKNNGIESVPPRENAVCIQTPQGFYTKSLLEAYRQAKNTGKQSYTDDSSVYAEFVGKPRVCAGARDNKKLTFAEDFAESFFYPLSHLRLRTAESASA